jgi:cysteine-rich repeat protein
LSLWAGVTPQRVNVNGSPVCNSRSGESIVLWPPNHRMVEIDLLRASGASDPDGHSLEVSALGITQDEAVNRGGDGDSGPDGAGVGMRFVQIRQERSGLGNGRVYEIAFETKDSDGASCTGSLRVSVPRSRGSFPAVDDGQKFDSTRIDEPGPRCGNGFLDPEEACDNGLLNSDTGRDACRADCTLPRCGDGTVDSGEICDDGLPANPNDGCDASCRPTTWTASLISGNGPSGGDPLALALNSPNRLARDVRGNIYVADSGNRRVLRVYPSGFVAVIAGKGGDCPSRSDSCGDGGPADAAAFSEIDGIAVDSRGNLYISEGARNRVRKIDALTNTIDTVVNDDGVACADPVVIPACGDGGMAGAADLRSPYGLTVDRHDRLYIADYGDYRVRRILPDPATGAIEQSSAIETVAGNGIYCPFGDCGDGGLATQASMVPIDVAVFVSASETRLYIADYYPAQRVRQAIVGGDISAFAGGTDGVGVFTDCVPATDYYLQVPGAVELDADGNLFITSNDFVYRVDHSTRTLCRVSGGFGAVPHGDGGPACEANLFGTTDVLVDPVSRDLIIANPGSDRIRRVTADSGVIHNCRDSESVDNIISTLVGNGQPGARGDGNRADATPITPSGIAVDASGAIHFNDSVSVGVIPPRIRRIGAETGLVSTDKYINVPTSKLAFDSLGNLYFLNTFPDSVYMLDANGIVRIVAGSEFGSGFRGDGGPATSALLDGVLDLTLDVHNNLYISERDNHRIRRVNAVAGQIIPGVSTITTVVGGGTNQNYDQVGGVLVGDIRLPVPSGLAITPEGTLYFSERSGAFRVFELPHADVADIYTNNTYRVRPIAGSGTRCATPLPPGPTCGDFGPALMADLRGPDALAYDPTTSDLFLADAGTNRVKRLRLNGSNGQWYIDPVAGNSQVLAGGRFFGDGGPATDAGLNGPSQLTLDLNHELLINDQANFRIRKVGLVDGSIHTLAGAVFPQGDRELAFSAMSSPIALSRLNPDLWLAADATSRRVRAVDPNPATGRVYSVAGYPGGFAGNGAPALYSRQLANPSGIAYDGSRYVYVSEMDNHTIRRIDTMQTPWTIETWAGVEGMPDPLNRPAGLAIDGVRSVLYVADTGNHVVRSVSLADPRDVRTVAGTPGTAGCPTGSGDAAGHIGTLLSGPVALSLNPEAPDSLFVVDADCNMVRRIDLAGGPRQSYRIIGDGTAGTSSDGMAGQVHLSAPRGAAMDGFGNLHVTSRNAVVTVASGTNGLPDESDQAHVIFGHPSPGGLEQYTDCLTGIAVVNPGDGNEDALFVLDRCLGSLLKLQRMEARLSLQLSNGGKRNWGRSRTDE